MTFKNDFLANTDACRRHADAVATAWYRDALRLALLEYSAQCQRGPDDPAACAHKTKGAFEFARLFTDFSIPPQAPVRQDLDNLSH